jgi:hypothetical protein
MEVIDEFANTHMDLDEYLEMEDVIEGEVEAIPKFSNYMADHKVLHLKNNFIPKGLVPLEQLFDRNDIPVKPVVLPKDESIEDCNIGIEHEPKYIKLSKYISVEHKKEYLYIFQRVYGCVCMEI